MKDLELELEVKDNERITPVICTLSKASLADILNIESQSDAPAWSERLFLQEFDNSHAHFFGARLGGQLIGFLLLHCISDEAHILKFGILPQFRGKGIGRVLISHVLRDLHANTAKWVTLEVRKTNEIAKKLYGSLGFSEVGIREHYYSDNGEDALVMSLNISHFIEEHGDHPELINDVSGLQRAFHLF